MMAQTEREMKRMIKSLEKYFDGKKLTLNVSKSKVLIFSRRETKKQERRWSEKMERGRIGGSKRI